MDDEIKKNIEIYKLSGEQEMYFSDSISLYGKDNRYDFDLSLCVGKAKYDMTISQEKKESGFWIFKKEKVRTVTNVKIYDTYDFDEYRDDTSISNRLNNWGYSQQNKGELTPYDWEVNYTVYGGWK